MELCDCRGLPLYDSWWVLTAGAWIPYPSQKSSWTVLLLAIPDASSTCGLQKWCSADATKLGRSWGIDRVLSWAIFTVQPKECCFLWWLWYLCWVLQECVPLSQCVVWGRRCYSTQVFPNREFFSIWIFEVSDHNWLKATAEENRTLRMAVSFERPKAASFSVLFLFAWIHSTGDWCTLEIQHIGSINCSESTCVPFTENYRSGQKDLTVLWQPFLFYHQSWCNA